MFSPASGDLLRFPPLPDHRRWRPSAAAEHAPSCPRCASPNTKFCYYNNYSLSQPRYFCKGCKRYWTKGGSLRNVPVGGGCRKNRRRRAAPRTPSHNNNYNPNNSTIGQPVGSGLDSGSGSGIDLAVVYANFLNPSAAAVSSGSEQDDGPQSEFPDEGSNGVEIYGSSSVMHPVDREQEPEFLIPGRVGLEESMGSLHDYGSQIQSLLEDGLVQDALWSSPDQTRPDHNMLTWQSVMQLQDLDLFQPGSDAGDCFKIDSGFNLAVDNWSSFNFQCI